MYYIYHHVLPCIFMIITTYVNYVLALSPCINMYFHDPLATKLCRLDPSEQRRNVMKTYSWQKYNTIPIQSQQRYNTIPTDYQQRYNTIPTQSQQRYNTIPINSEQRYNTIPTQYQPILNTDTVKGKFYHLILSSTRWDLPTQFYHRLSVQRKTFLFWF